MEILQQLQEAYAKNLVENMSKISSVWEDYCEANDDSQLEQLKFELHKAVGSTGVYGFKEISQQLKKIENQVTLDNVETIDVAKIEELFQQLNELTVQSQNEISTQTRSNTDFNVDVNKTTLLIIAEDKNMRDFLESNLSKIELKILSYSSVENCKNENEEDFDHVISIIAAMDDLSAEDAVELKNFENAHNIDVVMYKNKGDFNTRIEAVRKGATTYFNVPLNITMLADYINQLNWLQNASESKILLVDDCEVFSNFYKELFSNHGIEVETLSEPSIVIDKMMEFKPDLFLLDFYLPECNGIEIAKVIKQHQGFHNVPIVFLSSETDPKVHAEAKEICADEFLDKSMVPKDLLKNIKSRLIRSKKAHQLIEIDGLTGLYARRKLESQLENQVSLYHRHKRSFCYAIIDFDNFKMINDKYGHGVGDSALKHLAAILKSNLRSSDLAFRYGGEEFAIVMADTDLEAARTVMDRVRKQFYESTFVVEDKEITLSFSTGIDYYTEDKTIESLMEEADKNLYEAKKSGKNCIITTKDIKRGANHE